MKKYKVDPWFQTDSGLKFDFEAITPEVIVIEDIAKSLALQCRYAGHVRYHYSVAQHSILVSRILPKNLKLSGLMHDAAESYVHDIIKPYKNFIETMQIKMLENKISKMIYDKFSVRPYHSDSPEVKEADMMVLRAEATQVLSKPPIDDWHKNFPKYKYEITIKPCTWQRAENGFLDMFKRLRRL